MREQSIRLNVEEFNMSDLGDSFREHKEYMRQKHMREGWISNRYRTATEKEQSIRESGKLHDEMDKRTLNELKRLGIKAEWKNTHTFLIETPIGKIMLYDGKFGYFIYRPKTKTRIDIQKLLDIKALKVFNPTV